MNLRIEAAKMVLCNDDIEKALDILDSAVSVSDTIPDEIMVWEKFENEDIDSLVQIIDDFENHLEAIKRKIIVPNLFENVDFDLLKKQYSVLINMIAATQDEADTIEGLSCMLESVFDKLDKEVKE